MLEIFIPQPGMAVLSPYLKGMKTKNTWKMAVKYLSSLSFRWYNYEVYTFFPIKSALVPLATQMYYLRVQKSQINLTELNLRCQSGCIPPGSSRGEFLPCPSQVLEATCISWLVTVSFLLLLPSSH